MLGGRPSIDAAARLLRLEAALQQQAAAAALTNRQLDKLQARLRLHTTDIKSPLRQLQEAGAAQAEAVVRLAEQQAALSRQVEGVEEVVVALQGVGAKQFKVRAGGWLCRVGGCLHAVQGGGSRPRLPERARRQARHFRSCHANHAPHHHHHHA